MDKVTVTDERDGWEIFSDTSYFDMWCVRPVGEKRWGAGFHVVSRDGAEAARDYLIEATRQAEEQIKLLRGLVQVLLDNEPDDPISDHGHTVLDLWRENARAALEATNG